MLSLVSIAAVAFVITNLDDLAVLTAFCGHERFRFHEIVIGQYLGFGLLVVVSLVGGIGTARFFTDHVRWLGILPIVVGSFGISRQEIERNDLDPTTRLPTGQMPDLEP